MGLRLMIYDRTCRGTKGLPGLSHAWWAGGHIYTRLHRFDHWRGVAGWSEAFSWLNQVALDQPVDEIQYWGHGKWGRVAVGSEYLDTSALRPGHGLYRSLAALRQRMQSPEALWWFRCCEVFGADRGSDFARAWSEFFGSRAAGHTYVIGYWQSGLHSLRAGERPTWDPEEGLQAGTATTPTAALPSSRTAPNTIHCLHGAIPAGY